MSYYPDHPDHAKEARKLTNRLRELGFNAVIFDHHKLQVNELGLPRWISSNIYKADMVKIMQIVLVIIIGNKHR